MFMFIKYRSFEIGFEGSVRVDWSHTMLEGIPKRGANMPKNTRGEINVDTRDWEERLGEAERSRHDQVQKSGILVKVTSIEGIGWTSNNSGQVIIDSLSNSKPTKWIVVLVVERVTTRTKALKRCILWTALILTWYNVEHCLTMQAPASLNISSIVSTTTVLPIYSPNSN